MDVRAVLALAVLSGCFSTPARPETGSEWLAGYEFRKRVTLHRPSDAALLDDPMISIDTGEAPDLAAHAHATAGDVTFTTADGVTPIRHEVASYDPVRGALDAWLRVPEVTGGDTDLFLYYGAAPRVPQSAWPDMYRGVWHMSGAESGRERDSTNKVADLVPSIAGETPLVAPGVAGPARDYRYPGEVDGSELCAVTSALQMGVNSFTYSLWFFGRSQLFDYDSPFAYGGGDMNTAGFNIELGNGEWLAGISDGGGNAGDQQNIDLGAPRNGDWLFIAIVVDRETLPGVVRTYINGQQRMAVPLEPTIGSLTPGTLTELCIGSSAYRIDGLVDEVWVRDNPWSAEKIATHYANLADRSSFQTVGVEETAP